MQITKNNVSGVLSTPLTTGSTSLVLFDASQFPSPTEGEFYLVTLIGLNANAQEAVWEIVKVVAKASNTLSIQRAQEGTTARAWPSGTTVQMRLTAGSVVTPSHLASIQQALETELGTKASKHNPSFTGTVSGVTKAMVGLGNVDNTSDANKPISSATQTALNAKEPTLSPGTTGQYFRGDKTWQTLNKAAVGLGSVDNVSAAALRDRTTHTGSQAISTITNLQATLDAKVAKESGKGLSTNDFTTTLKNKLDGVETGAQKNAVPVDNLISTSTVLPLSANQGKVLKGFIDNINVVLQSDDSTLDELQEIVNFIKMNRATLETLGIGNIAGLTAALAGKVNDTDARLTNTREWTAATMSQAEAEAGSATTRRAVTAQRVRQAILGWWNNSTDKTKLDGIATQATKNASDAELRNRSTHTGSQAISTVTGLQGALDSKVDKVVGKQLSTEDFTTPEKTKLANINLGFPAVKPSLRLDFINQKKLDPRISFSRASDATHWDSLGVLQTAQPNEPRFDYDPVTGESLGLLIEGQATNLLSYSVIVVTGSTSSGNWMEGVNASVTPNAAIAPDGSLSGVRVTSTGSASSDNRIRQIISREVNPGDVYTFSVWLRADEETSSNLWIASANDTDGQNMPVTITTEWKRFSVSNTFTLSHSGVRVCINNAPSAHTTYVWGAQLEVGSVPTSYIPTEASQVTRAADNASIQTSDFLYNSYEGTFVVEAEVGAGEGFSHGILVAANEPDSFEGLGIVKRHEDRIAIQNRTLGTADNVVLLQDITGNVKAAISYQGVNFQGCANGGPVTGRSNGPESSEWETVYIGRGRVSGISPRHLGKPIKRITYFPRAFPEATLVELTAP